MTLPLAALAVSDWITAATIAAGSLAIAFVVRRYTKRAIRRKDTSDELIDIGGRLASLTVLFVGVYYSLRALNVELGPLFGALGIGVVFLAVGMQPLLVHFVGSVVLHARRPFRRGDQITSNGLRGTVIDITTTSVVVLSYDGEAIHIPNSQVLNEPLINWTHEPVRRTILPVSVPYGCDLRYVLAVLGRAARKALDDTNLPPAEAMAMGFGDHGIDVELRFWHYSEHLESLVARNTVICAVDEALKGIDVAIPFPQLVIHSADSPEDPALSDPSDPSDPSSPAS